MSEHPSIISTNHYNQTELEIGKTFIAASIATYLQTFARPPLLIFLSHIDQAAGGIIEVLHSLVFQAVKDDFPLKQALNSILKGKTRLFSSNRDFVKNTVTKILNSCDSEVIIIDGLDELEEDRRKSLLKVINEILDKCPMIKVLLSSRDEPDIVQALDDRSVSLRVDHQNSQIILAYAELELQEWISELRRSDVDGWICNAARLYVQRVVKKSEGMPLPLSPFTLLGF